MKHILLIFNLLISGVFGFSQSVDIGYSNNAFTDPNGRPVDANNFSVNQVARLQVAFSNNSFTDNAPAGRYRLIIGLGSGFVLNPSYNLATAPLSNYFTFTYAVTGGQGVITGTAIAPVPPLFTGLTYFEVKATTPGASTASFNITIDNSAGAPFFTDPNSLNNSALNPYNVNNIILPVTFAGLTAAIKDCNVYINWNVKSQQNLNRYEVEVSKDGSTFNKVAEVLARNQENYNYSILLIESLKAPVLYFRIKSVDKDSRFEYSSTATVKGQCNSGKDLLVSVFPNPAAYTSFVTVNAVSSIFNGKYKVSLVDKSGKVYQVRDMEFNNQNQFRYQFGNLAAGSYSIVVKGDNETNSAVVEFTKL